jgi:hypothetical protein
MNLVLIDTLHIKSDTKTESRFNLFESSFFNSLNNVDSKTISFTHGNISSFILNRAYLTIKSDFNDNIPFKFIQTKTQLPSILEIIKAIDLAINQKKAVLCMPFGFKSELNIFKAPILACIKKDINVVMPSGNYGNGKVSTPGIFPEVLCVGAHDLHQNVAKFSGAIFDENQQCIKPEILAPGVNIEINVEGETHHVNGTSFACAYTAGIAAALKETNPAATAYDVKMAIYESCSPAYGSKYGILNPEKALQNILAHTPYQKKNEEVDNFYSTRTTYIDHRLKYQCRIALATKEKVDSLIVANSTHELMQKLAGKFDHSLFEYTMFQNFDMSHIRASAEVHEYIFNEPEVEVCSAIDINYFDL